MLSTLILFLQACILDTILCKNNTVLSCIAILSFCFYTILRQHFYRKAFRNKKGFKKYKGYINYHFSRRCIFLFLMLYFMKNDMNLLIILDAVLFYLIHGIDFLMKGIIKHEVSQLERNLTPDSKIIIIQKRGCLSPGGLLLRIYETFIFPFLLNMANIKIYGTYQKYISISNITALICEDLIASHPKYLYIEKYHLEKMYCSTSKLRRKKVVMQSLYENCEQYLIAQNPSISNYMDDLPYPKEKVQIFNLPMTTSNWISQMIYTIEHTSHERIQLDLMFHSFLSYQTKEPGKLYARNMIQSMLDNQQNDTEYFYTLLKINDFMIHYQALSGYEQAKTPYFQNSEACAPSMGTFVSNIIETENTPLLKDEAFTQAVKFLHTIATGHKEKVPSKKTARYAREQMVTLRNRYTGHGTMTYSISQELLQQFAVVTQVLTEQFFQQDENMMGNRQIAAYDKCVNKDGRLYLLSAIYHDSNAYQYLDYATGQTLSKGNPLIVPLYRNKGEKNHEKH